MPFHSPFYQWPHLLLLSGKCVRCSTGGLGLLLIGGLVVFFRSYDQAGSVQQALHHYTPFQRQVRLQFLVFLLLLVVSTTAQKAVWWLAVSIIVLKAGLLVAYYLTTTIAVQSKMYYEELLYCCTVLHLRVPGIFFSEPFSLALLGLYASMSTNIKNEGVTSCSAKRPLSKR
jgi:hypothetical protein